MPRCLALCVVLLVSAVAPAAPVPKVVLSAEQEKEFDQLWDTAYHKYATKVQLYCRLVQEPEAAVVYLTRTLKPAKLTEKEAKAFIADLDSKDEATWKRAYRDLRVRDVRLAMPLDEAWEDAKTDEQKLRLGYVMFGYPMPEDTPGISFQLHPPDQREKGWYVLKCDNRAGRGRTLLRTYRTFDEWAEGVKGKTNWADPRVLIATAALERIGTPAARKFLTALADGRDGAWSTVEATAALDRLRDRIKKPEAGVEETWRQHTERLTKVEAVNVFLDRPKQTVELFKAKLRPPKLTAEGAKKLLARLFSDDTHEVRAALRELQVSDLRLGMNLQNAWEEAKTATHRCRLAEITNMWWDLGRKEIPDDFDIDERNKCFDFVFEKYERSGEKTEWHFSYKWREGFTDQNHPMGVSLPTGGWFLGITADDCGRDRWAYEETAIYILDVIGTDDAVAIIREMATGHPDAGPTKAAKDVLKRRAK